LGGALGLAVLSGVAAASTTHYLQHTPEKASALVHGFHTAYFAGAVFAVGAAMVATFVIKQKAVQAGDAAAGVH
jgi:hypothetical protein